MKPDTFNRKRILVEIPDASQILHSALHGNSPACILNNLPPELVPLAIDILQTTLDIKNLMRSFDLKRSSIRVKVVRESRDEWKRALDSKRAENRVKEAKKIEDDNFKALSKEDKRYVKTYGKTKAEYMKYLISEFKRMKDEGMLE